MKIAIQPSITPMRFSRLLSLLVLTITIGVSATPSQAQAGHVHEEFLLGSMLGLAVGLALDQPDVQVHEKVISHTNHYGHKRPYLNQYPKSHQPPHQHRHYSYSDRHSYYKHHNRRDYNHRHQKMGHPGRHEAQRTIILRDVEIHGFTQRAPERRDRIGRRVY